MRNGHALFRDERGSKLERGEDVANDSPRTPGIRRSRRTHQPRIRRGTLSLETRRRRRQHRATFHPSWPRLDTAQAIVHVPQVATSGSAPNFARPCPLLSSSPDPRHARADACRQCSAARRRAGRERARLEQGAAPSRVRVTRWRTTASERRSCSSAVLARAIPRPLTRGSGTGARGAACSQQGCAPPNHAMPPCSPTTRRATSSSCTADEAEEGRFATPGNSAQAGWSLKDSAGPTPEPHGAMSFDAKSRSRAALPRHGG